MITLKRTYHKHYTSGVITLPDDSVIYTLELPWRDNEPFVSCIREGVYTVDRDKAGRHQWYRLRNDEVSPRSDIEIHPANKLNQLQGCIAPCMQLLGGAYASNPTGVKSKEACELLIKWFSDDSFILKITEA